MKAPRLVERARVRRCVGDPPRQTEDPQSPPCVNYWEGDNGGATSRGVTRDEIRVAVPQLSVGHKAALAVHFNSRYEFYGRRLHLVDLPVAGNFRSPEGQRAMAAYADEELGVFASLQLPIGASSVAAFRAELSRRGILNVEAASGEGSRSSVLRSWAPYAWDYSTPLDVTQVNLAEFACKSLVGYPARHAGPAFNSTLRRFAIVYRAPLEGLAPPVTEPLMRGIERCGGRVEVVEEPWDQTARTVMLNDLRVREVTTLVYLSHLSQGSELMRSASGIGYQPEWIIVGTNAQHWEAQWRATGTADQRVHMMGVVPWNKFLPFQDKPAVWAMREVDASVDEDQEETYHGLLLLASGIQMAGPTLTPETFQAGLFGARFPNPGAGAAPYYQATVGFAPGHRVMVNDLAVVWWSEAAGGFCWLERGRRWSPGRWPQGEQPLFEPDPRNCR